jgi:hypothetical protein
MPPGGLHRASLTKMFESPVGAEPKRFASARSAVVRRTDGDVTQACDRDHRHRATGELARPTGWGYCVKDAVPRGIAMSRTALWLAVAAVSGGALSPLRAQKAPPPAAVHPQPATQPAATPGQGKVLRPAPGTSQPAAGAAAGAAPAGQAAHPAAAVTPQATRPGGPAANPSAFTAGLAMAPFGGGSADSALEYAKHLGKMLDSTIVSLVDVFRNTSGQPMVGAGSPAALSQRERDRWSRCRNLYWDLTTYVTAVRDLVPSLPSTPALEQAATALDSVLDSALDSNGAIAECDNVASMIAAPERWTPWQDQYETAARRFYREFYGMIRDGHERDRAFVVAVNAAGSGARRVPVPAGLPRNPPYAGAAPN